MDGTRFVIKRILDEKSVMLESYETGELQKADVSQLSISENPDETYKGKELILIPEKDWQIAQYRFSIIRELVEGNPTKNVASVAKEAGVYETTIYRWLNRYEETKLVSSLAPVEGRGAKGKSRLSPEVDTIINSAIKDIYLTNQRKPIQKTYLEIQKRCSEAGLEPPHPLTVRKRINNLPEYMRVRHRYGVRFANNEFAPKVGTFPGADYPLSVVQIDHTSLDIILVDEIYRKPVGRPWITVAIDVYSRMITGFYLSFDTPGMMGTGLCISHSILQKEEYLAKLGVSGDWPCWGKMRTIHVDNAKEFRGNTLKRVCNEYGIELAFRPVATPNWGGTVERFIKTLVDEVHALPGTTFSNPAKRKGYDSVKKASMSLSELEKWISEFIVNVYHNRIHSTLGVSPIEKYRAGIVGTRNEPGRGIPDRIQDARRTRLDFMPYEERTIQGYGVVIGNISYYHDVLRRWVNASEGHGTKSKQKKKFIFKIDPRDISVIYFYDPELKEYFEIPYRNMSNPAMSAWEYREAVRTLKEQGESKYDEATIFKAYARMGEIEAAAAKKTLKGKRTGGKKLLRLSKQASEQKDAVTTAGVSQIENESESVTISPSVKKSGKFFNVEHATS